MIDHVSLAVSNPEVSRAFYEHTLPSLDYVVVAEHGPMVAFGASDRQGRAHPEVWLTPEDNPMALHLALSASSVEQVKAFHRAALTAGGTDNGAPGERPHYQPGYYAAFVLDPDGHNIEAVYRGGTTEPA